MPVIREGSAEISVTGSVFYNPKMKRLRDISVLFLKAAGAKGALLDCTAATGIRGIRYALECKLKDATLIDINEEAYKAMKANVKRNKLKLEVANESIQEFASGCERAFDVIDLDPFGTPVPYVNDLLKVAKDGTLLLVTATDTATLCGAQDKACVKLYASKPLRTELCQETSVRILLSFIARTAAQFNFGIEPLLCLSELHYMRVFVRLRQGADLAVESVKSSGFGSYCPKCHSFYLAKGVTASAPIECEYSKDRTLAFGPLWLGSLYDNKLLAKMLKLSKDDSISKTLELLLGEVDTPLFYTTDKVTAYMKLGSVPKSEVLDALKKKGEASYTQFAPNGIKTGMGIRALVEAVRKARRS